MRGRAKVEVCLARQPIYNAHREVCGYELLHRNTHADTSAQVVDANQASAGVVLQALFEVGLSRTPPQQPVFINYTQPLLAMDPLLPPDRCVIEVMEDVPANPQTIASLQHLKDLGYRLALDDFVYSAALIPFLERADFVKLDVRALSKPEFLRHLALLKPFPVRVVAEKIESEEEFRFCRDVGCHLFQGFYLGRPQIVRGERAPFSHLSALSLLAANSAGDANQSNLAAIIDRDAVLTHGLLQLANSVLYGRREELRFPSNAVSLLGIDRIFRWSLLLALARQRDCPLERLRFSLQRAYTMEQVAAASLLPRHEAYVMGLLSALESILNLPLADLLGPLPQRFEDVLLNREGRLGAVLDAVIAFESGSLDVAVERGVDVQAVLQARLGAADSARRLLARLQKVRAAFQNSPSAVIP